MTIKKMTENKAGNYDSARQSIDIEPTNCNCKCNLI